MRLMRQGVGLLLAGSMVVACQTPPPAYQVERSRTYGQSKEQIWNKVLRFLKQNDITATRVDFAAGTIEAERSHYQDAGRADCPIPWVVDHNSNSNRRRKARPVDRDLALAIQVREAAGATDVALDARFQEEQINPWRNLPFDQPCRSKGVLERALLNALEEGKPASSIGSD
jgi:hypothetical protein